MPITYEFSEITSCNMCGCSDLKRIGNRLNKAQGLNPKKKFGISVTVFRCKNCGLVFSNPLVIPIDIADHYDVPPEEYWHSDYFKTDDGFLERNRVWLKRYFSDTKGLKSLDIGAGVGKMMLALEAMGFDSYGIEPSEAFCKMAEKKNNIQHEKLICKAVEDCTFPENTFDFINLSAVLEHVYDPSSVMKKIIPWLKPEGMIWIEVPSSKWLIGKLVNLYYNLRCFDYVTNLSPLHKPYHLYEFTEKSFGQNGEINNFEVFHVDYFVCKTYTHGMVDRLLKYVMRKTNTGMEIRACIKKKNTF